jgi:hypothetical protein
MRRRIDVGEFGARVRIGVARLHQRLHLQIGDAGQVEQAAKLGVIGHAGD